jgi:hypothetical protein
MTEKSERETSKEDEVETVTESPNLKEHPVGTDPEAERRIAEGIQEEMDKGALGNVLSDYSPEQFSNLVESLADDYQESKRRQLKYQMGVLGLSAIFVIMLFGGLTYFVLETGRNGSSLIFFAGTLTGYFMKLASDKF